MSTAFGVYLALGAVIAVGVAVHDWRSGEMRRRGARVLLGYGLGVLLWPLAIVMALRKS